MQRLTLGGASVTAFGSLGTGPVQFQRVLDVLSDPQGNVFVVDRDNNLIKKFTSGGAFIRSYGTPGNQRGRCRILVTWQSTRAATSGSPTPV